MKRDRAYYRMQRRRAISRKISVLEQVQGKESVQAWTRGSPGRLSKGKIHCSCPLCRVKSYDELSHRDRKQMESAVQQLLDGWLFLLEQIPCNLGNEREWSDLS